MLRLTFFAVFGLAAIILLTLEGRSAHAGIVAPEAIDFGADDLERSLYDGSGGACAAPSESESPSPLPTDDCARLALLGLLNNSSSLPTGGSSPSSSSSTSGAYGSGAMIPCVISGLCNMHGDAQINQLAENHGLSLPDPPGTDLLRPPRG
jgi:hypothetical protein